MPKVPPTLMKGVNIAFTLGLSLVCMGLMHKLSSLQSQLSDLQQNVQQLKHERRLGVDIPMSSPLSVTDLSAMSCITMPTMSMCTEYTYPASAINQNLDLFCSNNTSESACLIRSQCSSGGLCGQYCEPFSLLADVCNNANSESFSECSDYNSMCASGTKVPQCLHQNKIPDLVSSSTAKTDVLTMCKGSMGQHMSACQNCVSETECKAPLSTLAAVCKTMEMPSCANFMNMCKQFGQEFHALCGQYASSTGNSCSGESTPYCSTGMDMTMFMNGFVGAVSPSTPCLVFLFKGWSIDTSGKMAGAIIFTFFLGILNVYLICLRRMVYSSFPSQLIRKTPSARYMRNILLFAAFSAQLTTAYALMLLVMSYFSGLFFAATFGIAAGHVFFSGGQAVVGDLEPCCIEPLAGRMGSKYNAFNYVSLEENTDIPVVHLRLEGMTCKSCTQTVSAALMQVEGVQHAEVSMKNGGEASVYYTGDQVATLLATVEGVGFGASVKELGNH